MNVKRKEVNLEILIQTPTIIKNNETFMFCRF